MDLTACPDCDLLQTLPELEPGSRACCARCGHVLVVRAEDPITRPLALSVAAAILLVIANTMPMMSMSVIGRHASTTILGGCLKMWQTGQPITAVLVAFCALVAPALFVLFLLAVLLAARRPPAPPWVGELLRWSEFLQPWAMVEVMMLGVLVALVKIAELATVEPGLGMFAIFGLMILFPAIATGFDEDAIWRRVTWADGELPHTSSSPPLATP
ncbi:MAG: paraquat-inducible protein A [Steroidobacteraceae bacterium]|nr:paraquat-inducible protein A [Steroidobacteraceae bacterium]